VCHWRISSNRVLKGVALSFAGKDMNAIEASFATELAATEPWAKERHANKKTASVKNLKVEKT